MRLSGSTIRGSAEDGSRKEVKIHLHGEKSQVGLYGSRNMEEEEEEEENKRETKETKFGKGSQKLHCVDNFYLFKWF